MMGEGKQEVGKRDEFELMRKKIETEKMDSKRAREKKQIAIEYQGRKRE